MVKSSLVRVAAAVVVLAACGASVGCYFLGDHFFRASGRVVDCSTLTPIGGADIAINVDRGDNPGPYHPEVANATSAMGQFDLHTDLSGGTWITLTFKKAGYVPLMYQFQGAPKAPVELCITPLTTP